MSSIYHGEDRVPVPPADAERFTTVCSYCIVGCGYKVYKWPLGKEGGALPIRMPCEQTTGPNSRNRPAPGSHRPCTVSSQSETAGDSTSSSCRTKTVS